MADALLLESGDDMLSEDGGQLLTEASADDGSGDDGSETAQLATLLTQIGAMISRQDGVISANADFYAGTLDDPDSFDASGGKSGVLGFYPLTLATGATVYFPCLARVQAMAAASSAGVAAYRFRLALKAQGVLQTVIDALPTLQTSEITIRWTSGAPIAPNDPLAAWIKSTLAYTDAQMAALFATAA